MVNYPIIYYGFYFWFFIFFACVYVGMDFEKNESYSLCSAMGVEFGMVKVMLYVKFIQKLEL